MTEFDVSAYLSRLGFLDPEPPSAGALRRLHIAHVECVPYETLEIQLGRVTSLDPAESARRIISGRGGYCFHLNGAFSALLQALGYQVTLHRGGTQMTAEDTPEISLNHLALTVEGLPGDPETAWFVDVGLGDGLHAPLPLRAGTYRQGPFEYGLRPSEIAPGGWSMAHDPTGSFVTMDFAPEPAAMSDFANNHEKLSTSPESGFVRTCTMQRRDKRGVDILRALTLSRVPEPGKTLLETEREWWSAVSDLFGISPAGFSAEERARLWRTVVAQHEAHLAAQAQS
ncbi:arylamine N-acetyltransferase family protein [Prauserella cavernicola]|uniref:Arylamine N-acetyltransferase n=1 Tax=Prauserella cavernicola TaxID=2800127 RepID=A0A934QUK3_9PSEU|nr:arylamine N-acetyltransferase [Prauserella cavernicola]MBK1785884.1 arylamine N-acetyltransferase [Prauserella cavernicola]